MPKRESATQTIKASDARQHFSQLLNLVFRGETRVIVEKSGVPVAAIISPSPEDLGRLDRLDAERDQDFSILDEIGEAFEDVSPQDLERQVTRGLSAARRQARKVGPVATA